jgi:excinuclease ABC subunit B
LILADGTPREVWGRVRALSANLWCLRIWGLVGSNREAARLRDEVKRLRASELAVWEDPTGRAPSPANFAARALRGRGERAPPRKPTLDEMGPGPDKESLPYRPGQRGRSTAGKGGTHAWRGRRR